MTKIDATIRLSILATLGYKLNNKEMDELATAIQDIVKREVMTAYNVGKHDALDNIEITSEEYYNKLKK
jgi:hypothetical protein